MGVKRLTELWAPKAYDNISATVINWIVALVLSAPPMIFAIPRYEATKQLDPATVSAVAWVMSVAIAPQISSVWHKFTRGVRWTALSTHALLGFASGALVGIFAAVAADDDVGGALALVAGIAGGLVSTTMWWTLRRPDQDTPSPPAARDEDSFDNEGETP